MWPTIIVCGALMGRLDCIQIGEPTLPMTAAECSLKLKDLDGTLKEFRRRHPEYRKYIEAWRGCDHVPGEET